MAGFDLRQRPVVVEQEEEKGHDGAGASYNQGHLRRDRVLAGLGAVDVDQGRDEPDEGIQKGRSGTDQ